MYLKKEVLEGSFVSCFQWKGIYQKYQTPALSVMSMARSEISSILILRQARRGKGESAIDPKPEPLKVFFGLYTLVF